MVERALEKQVKKCLCTGLIILVSGCVEDNRAVSLTEPAITAPAPSEINIKEAAMERVSDDQSMLRSKGWSNLASQLGRPKAVALLWYHVRTSYGVDAKLLFGSPNKLEAAIAIQVMNESDALPRIKVKGVEYYVINPMVPEFMGEFKYGDMFDDPGGGNNYLAGNFRLRQEDLDRVEKWMKETGARVEYSDFPGK